MAGQTPIASSLLAVRPSVVSAARPLSGGAEPTTPFTLPSGTAASPLMGSSKPALTLTEKEQELTLLTDELLDGGLEEALSPLSFGRDQTQAVLTPDEDEESATEPQSAVSAATLITDTEAAEQAPEESGKSLPFAAQATAPGKPLNESSNTAPDLMAEASRRGSTGPVSTAAVPDGELLQEQDAERFLNPAGQSPLGKLMDVKGSAGSVTLEKTDSAQPLPMNPADTLSAERLRTPAERGFTVQSEVRVPVGQQPQWNQAVGERMLWLASQKVSVAELRLDPPELGPLQVRISVQQEQVSVTFTSAHLGVREALDQSANRLRELFSEQGLELVNVDISDQAQEYESQPQTDSQGGAAGDDEDDSIGQESGQAQNLRLVDHYV